MNIKVLGEIIIKNLLLAFRLPFLAGILLLLLTSLVFPSAGLNTLEAGKPIEMMLSFVGITMMIAVFLPEKDESVKESVDCRKMDLLSIRFIRMIASLILIVLLIATYCFYLRWNECRITPYMVWGGIASAIFLGSIAFFVAGITGNSINGILAAVIYYLCNYGLKNKLGVFFLFRMSIGIFSGKIWLVLGGIVLIAFTFVIKRFIIQE